MRVKYQLIALLLILAGCREKEGFSPADFPKRSTAEVHFIGGPLEINLPLDLCIEGNSICVLAYTPDYWLHIYDRTSGELLSEAMPSGRGPGEAVNVMSMDYDYIRKLLYVHDPSLGKSVRFRFDGENGQLHYADEISHPDSGVVRQYHLLPDERFLYEGYLQGDDRFTRFFLYDDGLSYAKYSEYPGIEKDEDRFCFLLSGGKSEPVSGKYVSGTLYGAVLECFDLSEGCFKCTGIRLLDPPRMDLGNGGMNKRKGTKWGFSTLCPTKDCIYANYLDNDDANDFSAISVFGWDGREQARYETGHNILRIASDADDNRALYVVAVSGSQEYLLGRIRL